MFIDNLTDFYESTGGGLTAISNSYHMDYYLVKYQNNYKNLFFSPFKTICPKIINYNDLFEEMFVQPFESIDDAIISSFLAFPVALVINACSLWLSLLLLIGTSIIGIFLLFTDFRALILNNILYYSGCVLKDVVFTFGSLLLIPSIMIKNFLTLKLWYKELSLNPSSATFEANSDKEIIKSEESKKSLLMLTNGNIEETTIDQDKQIASQINNISNINLEEENIDEENSEIEEAMYGYLSF